MDHVQKSLLEVKAYYVSLLGDYELKIAHVKKQILHVEALLPDFLPPLSLQILDPNFPQPQVVSDIVDAIIDAESDGGDGGDGGDGEFVGDEEGDFDHNEEDELLNVSNTSAETEFPLAALDASIDNDVISELPVKGDYRRIYSVFQENKEKILHFQYILSSVYQPQHTHTFALKRKLRSELDYGVKRGFWNKVADEEGCYQARFGG